MRALGQIKQSAARVNKGLGVLDPKLADAIVDASQKARAREPTPLTRLRAALLRVARDGAPARPRTLRLLSVARAAVIRRAGD